MSSLRSSPFQPAASFAVMASGILLAGLALAAFTLALPHQDRALAVNLTSSLIHCAAVWILTRRYRQGGPARLFFLLIALALSIHIILATGRTLEGLGMAWLHLGPRAGFLLPISGPALQAVAIFFWPTSRAKKGLRRREVLDALLFSTSLFLVFWLSGLGQLASRASIPPPQKVAQIFISLDYTLLMGLALYRGLNTIRFSNALGWMLAAFCLISVFNMAWIALNLRGLPFPDWLDSFGAILIPVLYLLAALAPIPTGEPRRFQQLGWSSLALPYLPFLLVLPLVASAILHHAGPAHAVALWLGLGMVLMLLFRQMVALWDFHHFSRDLKTQVQERTVALEESQAILLRNQRMNLLATLGAGLAHDFKNLLCVMALTAEVMEEDCQEGRPLEAKDLQNLRSAIRQSGELIEKLLALGHQREPGGQLFDLRARIQGLAKLLERLATPAVQIRWALGAEALHLEMDPVQVEQILVNLVANARDAMPVGGDLRISLARSRSPEGVPQAVLAVADGGTGIAQEHLDHLFQAFFTTKEPGKGTGLGLASVKAILDECGATIRVESELGTGTTFSLAFPLADPLEP